MGNANNTVYYGQCREVRRSCTARTRVYSIIRGFSLINERGAIM